jgi:hypothetical protein|uniref:Uncharacterized protein n=1 Tax=Mus musculus TaxID=10090 RepID=Q3TZ36_MOUSE|nr:unnamed protein product [Mus musculus]
MAQAGFMGPRSWLDGARETKLPGAVPAGVTVDTLALPLCSSLGSRQRDPKLTWDTTEVPSLQSELRKWLLKGGMKNLCSSLAIKTVFILRFILSVAWKCPESCLQLLRHCE